ncbi:MAG: hypothetical protein JWP74_1309 [Marmoricola sp.]|nr:hypothetical protein [Marmoricola sp.]
MTQPRGRGTVAVTMIGRVLTLTLLVLVGPGLTNAAHGSDGSTLTLTGPPSVVDEQSATLHVVWQADGLPVGGSARLWQHTRDQAWQPGPALDVDVLGQARIVVRPRVDTWYQARGDAGATWPAATSGTLYVDNVPPAQPVVLPTGAPVPHALPDQPRATQDGAAVSVTRIPDAVWQQMIGRSWHRGCPVGRTRLRYVRVNYWGFDGYRHRGELVVRAAAADEFTRALQLLYEHQVPIRSMYLPDRFGYSARSGGADDFASMAADNSSAFNCRWVTGSRGVRSPHAYGRAFDLDPFENPYHSAAGWLPDRWWVHHGNARYAWRSGGDLVVRLMRASGFHWTYPTSDPQHFDA